MKTSWYFGALILIFTLLGVYQNRISEPNQEIVLQFSDVEITSDDAQTAIADVKKQLHTIGINTFKVQELKDGQLKISYYSVADISSIKDILSKGNKLKIGFSSNTSSKKKKSKTYKFDVYEIQKSNDLESGLDGKYVINIKQDYDRFYNPNVFILSNHVDSKDENGIVKVAFKVFTTIAVAIDNTSGNIPEVRAGPSANGLA
jgi:hypothetical protein